MPKTTVNKEVKDEIKEVKDEQTAEVKLIKTPDIKRNLKLFLMPDSSRIEAETVEEATAIYQAKKNTKK